MTEVDYANCVARFASVQEFLKARGEASSQDWDLELHPGVRIGLDLFNLLNSNVTLQYNTTFTPSPSTGWLAPTEMMTARLARIGAEFTW